MATSDNGEGKLVRDSVNELLKELRKEIIHFSYKEIRERRRSKLYKHVLLIPLRRPKSISVYINTRGRSVPDDNAKSKPILTLRLSDHVRPRHEKPGTKTYLADDRIYMMDQDGSEML